MFFKILEKFNTMTKDFIEETHSNYRRIVQRKVKEKEWTDETGRQYFFAGFNSENDVVFFSYDDPKNKNLQCSKWVTMSIQDALCSDGKFTLENYE